MPNIPAEIDCDNSNIVIGLPLTNPTGKIRVKTKPGKFEFGEPIATRQRPITENCYIEWQIGYDNPDPSQEGVIRELSFYARGGRKYAAELTAILYRGLRGGIFSRVMVNDLMSFAGSVTGRDFIEENTSISRIDMDSMTYKDLTFHIIEEKYPLYLLEKSDYEIEVVVRHKQRAVGYQAMIYVCLPIKNAEERVVGRSAKAKELVHFEVNQTRNNFVYDAFKIFSLASKKHNEDIISILGAIDKML